MSVTGVGFNPSLYSHDESVTLRNNSMGGMMVPIQMVPIPVTTLAVLPILSKE